MMITKKNKDLLRQVQQATFQGRPDAEMKALRIQLNSFDVDLDQPIYRIMELDYFIEDVSQQKLTHIKPCQATWGDSYENPLSWMVYKDQLTGGGLSLQGIVEDFYALSWTVEPKESRQMWEDFSYGKKSVRIQSTPRKLLDALMSLDDKHHAFHHYIGKVEYIPKGDLIKHFETTPYEEHLDPLGQGAALSLMLLRSCFKSESEVRLLYSYRPHECDYVRANVIQPENTYQCKVPMDWTAVLSCVVMCPDSDNSDYKMVEDALSKSGVRCAITASELAKP